MRQEGSHDRRDDERRSEDGEWRRDDPQDDWDGHGKDANDEHSPRRDHRSTSIEIMSESRWERLFVPHQKVIAPRRCDRCTPKNATKR